MFFLPNNQDLKTDNQTLRKEVSELQVSVDSAKTQNIRDKQQLRTVHDQLGSKMQELLNLHSRATAMLQS